MPRNLSDAPRGRIYYGWVMLPIATLAMIATSPGQTFGISAFNEPIRTALNLSHSQLTGAYMLGTFLASLPMSYVGAVADRVGLRAVMTIVVIAFGLVCMATSQVTGLLTIFLAFLLLRMLGQGALGLLSGNTLAYWFEKRLGTVEGFRHVGMAGAIATLPAINLWLIDTMGWRWAWVVLGAAIWILMLPLMLVFRNRPADVGQRVDGGNVPEVAEGDAGQADIDEVPSWTLAEACRTRAFWIACGNTALWSMLNTAVMFNIVPLFLERGLAETDAAALFTIYAISLAVMHVVGGMLADRLPLNLLLTASALGLAVCMMMFWRLATPEALLPLGLAMGASQGLLVAATGPMWPRYYGRAHLGRIRGMIATLLVSASSIGPFLMGVTRDLTGSYDAILAVFAMLPLPFVVLSLFATRPVRCESDDDGDSLMLASPPEAAIHGA